MGNIRKLNILIVGGNFIGKGAEAMMFTVQDVIKSAAPDSLLYVVPKYEEEKKLLIENGFIPLVKNRLSFGKRFFQLLKVYIFRKRLKKEDIYKNIDKGLSNEFLVSDLVIDISGFASGDQWGWKKALSRAIDFQTAKFSGNIIVFMPQSWGPFKSLFVRVLTKILLNTANLVFAREQLSYNYLLESNCVKPNKLFFSMDIAFTFKAINAQKAESIFNNLGIQLNGELPIIAITPNIRIYQRTKGEGHNNTYLIQLFEVIDYFLLNTNSNILLVPHEFFRDINDLKLCELILEHYLNNNRIFTTSKSTSASEVKAVIGCCDLIIASRYHSLVAALSMGVVPVVIGWSHKYDELIKFFELEKLVTDSVSRVQDNLIEVVADAWENRVNYKTKIINRLPEVEKSSSIALQKLSFILNEMTTTPVNKKR